MISIHSQSSFSIHIQLLLIYALYWVRMSIYTNNLCAMSAKHVLVSKKFHHSRPHVLIIMQFLIGFNDDGRLLVNFIPWAQYTDYHTLIIHTTLMFVGLVSLPLLPVETFPKLHLDICMLAWEAWMAAFPGVPIPTESRESGRVYVRRLDVKTCCCCCCCCC